MKRLGLLATVTAAVLFGASTPASAEPPANVHWLYTASGSGAVFFDADLAGYPSYEKITVCDNRTDGRGIYAWVEGVRVNPSGPTDHVGFEFRDPSNDGQCRSWATDYFAEGYGVYVQVCEYWGDNIASCKYTNRGVS